MSVSCEVRGHVQVTPGTRLPERSHRVPATSRVRRLGLGKEPKRKGDVLPLGQCDARTSDQTLPFRGELGPGGAAGHRPRAAPSLPPLGLVVPPDSIIAPAGARPGSSDDPLRSR